MASTWIVDAGLNSSTNDYAGNNAKFPGRLGPRTSSSPNDMNNWKNIVNQASSAAYVSGDVLTDAGQNFSTNGCVVGDYIRIITATQDVTTTILTIAPGGDNTKIQLSTTPTLTGNHTYAIGGAFATLDKAQSVKAASGDTIYFMGDHPYIATTYGAGTWIGIGGPRLRRVTDGNVFVPTVASTYKDFYIDAQIGIYTASDMSITVNNVHLRSSRSACVLVKLATGNTFNVDGCSSVNCVADSNVHLNGSFYRCSGASNDTYAVLHSEGNGSGYGLNTASVYDNVFIQGTTSYPVFYVFNGATLGCNYNMYEEYSSGNTNLIKKLSNMSFETWTGLAAGYDADGWHTTKSGSSGAAAGMLGLSKGALALKSGSVFEGRASDKKNPGAFRYPAYGVIGPYFVSAAASAPTIDAWENVSNITHDGTGPGGTSGNLRTNTNGSAQARWPHALQANDVDRGDGTYIKYNTIVGIPTWDLGKNVVLSRVLSQIRLQAGSIFDSTTNTSTSPTKTTILVDAWNSGLSQVITSEHIAILEDLATLNPQLAARYFRINVYAYTTP